MEVAEISISIGLNPRTWTFGNENWVPPATEGWITLSNTNITIPPTGTVQFRYTRPTLGSTEREGANQLNSNMRWMGATIQDRTGLQCLAANAQGQIQVPGVTPGAPYWWLYGFNFMCVLRNNTANNQPLATIYNLLMNAMRDLSAFTGIDLRPTNVNQVEYRIFSDQQLLSPSGSTGNTTEELNKVNYAEQGNWLWIVLGLVIVILLVLLIWRAIRR